MDLQIDDIDQVGAMGAFVLSRSDNVIIYVPFVFNGERRELSYHTGALDGLDEYRTAFFNDVESAWVEHLCELHAAESRQLRNGNKWDVN